MKTNKVYRDAVLLMSVRSTGNALANKWVKLAHTTQDPQLQHLSKIIGRLYGLTLSRSHSSYTNPIQVGGIVSATISKFTMFWRIIKQGYAPMWSTY